MRAFHTGKIGVRLGAVAFVTAVGVGGLAMIVSGAAFFFGAVTVVLLSLLVILSAWSHKLTRRNVSLALWVVLVIHRAFIPRVESVNIESLSWSPLVIAELSVTAIVFMFSLLLLLDSLGDLKLVKPPVTLQLLAIYALVAILSLSYSPSPLYTGFWLTRLVSGLFLLMVYFRGGTLSDVTRFANATLISMIPYLALPWLGFIRGAVLSNSRVTSLWLHPGQASIIGYAVGVGYFVKWLLFSRDKWALVIAIFGLGAAFIAAGKTAAVSMLLVLTLIFVGTWRMWFSGRRVIGVLIIGLGLAVLATTGIGLLSHLDYYQQLGLATLKARFSLWGSGLVRWAGSPLLGTGFASTRVVGITAPDIQWATTHAHNSFLESLMELGILGSLPLFMAIGIVLFRLLRTGPPLFRLNPVGPIAAAWSVLLFAGWGDLVFGGILQPPTYLFLGLLVPLDLLSRRVLFVSGQRLLLGGDFAVG